MQGLFGCVDGAYFTDLTLTDADLYADADVGALVGKSKGAVIQRVAVIEPIVKGRDHIGGLIGGTVTKGATIIEDCYVENGIIISSEYQAGGILGVASETLVKNTYFTGTITVEGSVNENRDGSGIVSRIEGGKNSLRGVASLATSVTCGSANEFISYGDGGTALNEFSNCYTRNDMVLSAYVNPNRGGLLSRATEDQKRPLADFKSQALYESMGWDFDNTWIIPAGGGFPIFRDIDTSIPSVSTQIANNLKAYTSGGMLVLEPVNATSVWVYNLSGTLIKRIDIDTAISLSLPKGAYIIKSVSGGNVEAIKVMN